MTNSRQKGARGEREAAKFLASIGFQCSRMGRNGKTAADLDLSQCELNLVHIEVKVRESMKLGSKALDDAMEQARLDSEANYPVNYDSNGTFAKSVMRYACLWKRNHTKWRLSFICPHMKHRVTADTDAGIAAALRMLNERNP